MKKNTKNLADKIADVLNVVPSSIDPEDNLDETKAQVEVNYSEDENSDEEVLLAKFRKNNIDFLADVDEKYAGKTGSRKELRQSDDESGELSSEAEADDDYEETTKEEIDEESEEIESDEEGNSSDENDNQSHSDGESNEKALKHFKDTNVSNQVKKGLCVRNQLSLWEGFLEMRIQLQKCLITSNKLPQLNHFKEIKEASCSKFTAKIDETKNNVCNVLDKLLELQNVLQKQYPETKKLFISNSNKKEIIDNEDEEIPSDTEDELQEDSDSEKEATPRKKRKLNEYEKTLDDDYKKYKNYCNDVIQKWNEKTRLQPTTVGKNTASNSVLKQIDFVLSDKTKLIKKTQLKRSQYEILGETSQNDNTDDYNTEIFDDDDFYHQLLRDLIEFKSSDITDPIQLGRQWIQLQSLRSKMKRKIDTRATKGRKIRYAIHSKLVNFMAPIDENLWTDEAKTELYSSLFGKAFKK